MNRHYFSVLSGPLTFLLVYLIPIAGLPYPAHVVLATFGWAVVWWILQPVPLGITSLLPLVIFPLFGLMNVSAVANQYGQSILFWLMGTSLMGWALEKHGVAKRFALGLLSIRGVARTTSKVAFVYMLATALLSFFISDLAAIAIAIPLGLSIASYVNSLIQKSESGTNNFAKLMVMAAFLGSVAGGMATIAGSAVNAISVSLLNAVTGTTIGWFEWMARGVPISLGLLVGFFLLLRWFFPPEERQIPGGEEFMRGELRKLGKWSRGESNVVGAFILMVVLFLIGPVSALVLGTRHFVALWLNQTLEIWIVPPIILFLLFLLPVDIQKREFTLHWKEAVEQVPWSIILLTLSATVMMQSLGKFGFLEFMETVLAGFRITVWTLPLIALMFGFSSNFISAIAFTTLAGGIFLPAAVHAGFDTVTMAMMIPNLAIGVAWPWAGPTSATAFASGKVGIKDMIKVGLPATVVMVIVMSLVHTVFLSFQN